MIVEIDIVIHNLNRILKILDFDMPQQFFFQVGKEIFGWRIVQTVSLPGHGWSNSHLRHQLLIS